MTDNSDRGAAAYLEARGIKSETVSENGVELCLQPSPSIYRFRLKFDNWHNGKMLPELVEESIWFPCRDANTTIHSWIMRPLPALPAKDSGGEVKFLSPRGEPSYPFIPAATWAVKDKANYPLLITEGPCKALSALQAGAFPIAGSGVWMMTEKVNEAGATRLHQALTENFVFRGRIVYVAFDADFALNPSVRQALIRVAVLLHKTGAEVKVLTWPLHAGKGLDDFLAKPNGEQNAAQTLELLCKDACNLGGVLSLCDLEFFELEASRARLKGSVLSQLCKLVSKSLGVPVETLKEGIKSEYEGQEQAVGMADPEPWPESVDGAALADELAEAIKRCIAMEERQASAIALWILLTYLEASVDVLPLLAILSPVKRCGKTNLLSLLSRLVSKPLTSSNASSASLYRVIERFHPTLLVDEVDSWLKDNEEARGIINSGHSRDMAYVIRCNANSGEPERFSTWAPKVLAGIGHLPDTLADRSIIIHLERRKPSQEIRKLRDMDPGWFAQMRPKFVRWALDHCEEIKESRPAIPDVLNDREGDNWFPLFSIADQLGGNWPAEARKIALSLSDAGDTETVNILLLMKIREILAELPDEKEFIPTVHLIEELNVDKSQPWADWLSGKGLTPQKLARILKDFGLKPKREWNKTEKKQEMSYNRKDLEMVLERYSPSKPVSSAIES